MKPVSDEAQIALDFPDKVYMGSFSRNSRYAVAVENGGLYLKLAKTVEPKRSFDVHLHHYLLVDILRDWAKAIRDDETLTDHDRNDLREAVADVVAALGDDPDSQA